MFHIIFGTRSLDILIHGWSDPSSRLIMLMDLAAAVIGAAVGLFVPGRRWKLIVFSAVGVLGVMGILKGMFWLRNDGEILFPLLGEALLLGALIGLIVTLCRRRRAK